MNKSILEKRIHDKAEERADKYFTMIRLFFRDEGDLVNKLALTNNKEKIYFKTDHWHKRPNQ